MPGLFGYLLDRAPPDGTGNISFAAKQSSSMLAVVFSVHCARIHFVLEKILQWMLIEKITVSIHPHKLLCSKRQIWGGRRGNVYAHRACPNEHACAVTCVSRGKNSSGPYLCHCFLSRRTPLHEHSCAW